MSSIGEVISGYTFRGAIAHDDKGNYSVVQAKNINKDGTVSYEDLIRTSIEKMRSKGLVENGDVLLSNRGTFRSAIFRSSKTNNIAASSLYILRITTGKVLPEYLMVFLNSPVGQKLLQSLNTGTIIKTIPRQNLLNLEIPVPSVEKQQQAVTIYQNYHSRVSLYEKKVNIEKNIASKALSLLIPH